MVPVFHFLLVNIVDELLDLVLAVARLSEVLLLGAQELLLEDWGKLRDLEIFTVLWFLDLWS